MNFIAHLQLRLIYVWEFSIPTQPTYTKNDDISETQGNLIYAWMCVCVNYFHLSVMQQARILIIYYEWKLMIALLHMMNGFVHDKQKIYIWWWWSSFSAEKFTLTVWNMLPAFSFLVAIVMIFCLLLFPCIFYILFYCKLKACMRVF